MTTTPAPDTQEIMRAYRVCLDPSHEQLIMLRKHAGFARRGYNWARAEKIAAWEAQQQERAWLTYTTYAHLPPESAFKKAAADAKKLHPIPGYATLSTRYTVERGEADPVTDEIIIDGIFPWYKGLNRHAFVSGLRHADTAFGNFFDSIAGRRKGRAMGYPRKKKRGRARDSFAIFHDVKKPSIRADDSRHLTVPTIGRVRLHSNLRRLVKKLTRGTAYVRSVTIAREGDRWFASVLAAETIPTPRSMRHQQAAGAVGVDVGVNRLATMSDGTGVENPRHLRHAKTRLEKAQRALSRTQKGSANRRRAAQRVGRIHARLAEQRVQYLHQLTKRLAGQYALIGVEDLDVAAMTKSARGTVETPGRQVRQKAGLNREILDVSFGELIRQLEYKAGWYGSSLQKVDRWYPSSKTCSACGYVKSDLGRGDRTYHCAQCGLVLDRDHNAAVNLAAEASRLVQAAKATPSTSRVSTTPATCDKRGPEANIGRPVELDGSASADHRVLMQEDPRGHPGRAIGRRPTAPHGATAIVMPEPATAGHSP